MFTFLSAGAVLGLSAGFSPGPLLTLVITQTMKHGVKEGTKVALAPLLTDFPIILLSTLVLARLANYRPLLGLISLLGGVFVLYLAYGTLRTESLHVTPGDPQPQSFIKGAMVNALSPHPYLFWLIVGAPMIVKGWAESAPAAVAFVAGFLGCLVGAKVCCALLAGKSKRLLCGKAYGYLMRVLGVLLLLFAFLLLKDAAVLLAWLRG